jgi:hypothetical protein
MSESRDFVGAFLPTYSGRIIDAGTSRIGEISPGTKLPANGVIEDQVRGNRKTPVVSNWGFSVKQGKLTSLQLYA